MTQAAQNVEDHVGKQLGLVPGEPKSAVESAQAIEDNQSLAERANQSPQGPISLAGAITGIRS